MGIDSRVGFHRIRQDDSRRFTSDIKILRRALNHPVLRMTLLTVQINPMKELLAVQASFPSIKVNGGSIVAHAFLPVNVSPSVNVL